MKKHTKSIVGVAIILVIVAGLATGLGIAVNRNNLYNNTLNNIYSKSYYEAMDTLSDSELKLAKINISANYDIQSELLNSVATDCALIVDRLSDLTGENDNLTTVISLINQLGDYCSYLANRATSGTLSAEESENLELLHSLVVVLQENLTKSGLKITEDSPISSDITAGITLLTNVCEYFSSDEVSYPELVYDGPFSDTDTSGEFAILSNLSEITEEEAKSKVSGYFEDATDIEKIGESNGDLSCYIYQFNLNGETCYIEITKVGGLLLEYSSYRNVEDPQLTTDECKGLAEEYAEAFGYSDLTVVWVANNNSMVYVNLAYTADGIIYYNDLIQIKVASDDGALIGIDATNYIVNHQERESFEIVYTEEDALLEITDKLQVETIRLAVIPYGNTERITYEIFGSYNDEYYFIYVCAELNCELEIKRVSENNGTFWVV